MRILAMTIGLPASGKTWFVQNWPCFNDFLRIEADQFAPIYNRFWETLEREGKDHNRSIVIDGTFNRIRARARAMSLMPDAKIIGYVFPFDLGACLRRNAARSKRLSDAEIIRKARVYEPPELSEGFHELICVPPIVE